jgi:AcrR family transcriptional regulator
VLERAHGLVSGWRKDDRVGPTVNDGVHRTLATIRPTGVVVKGSVNAYVHAMATRKYELKQRAERQAETRQRIVAAVVALHREVGPARTTISAIAERAGVERLTVYRHLPDETAMFQACSARFAGEVAPPDPAVWREVAEPPARLRAALLAFYDYYRRAEDMLAHVQRDAPQLPALAAVVAPWDAFVGAVRDGLLDGWAVPTPGPARARLAAAIAHALRFDTWRSLARAEGLDDAGAADLMVALAHGAAGPPPADDARGTCAA